MKHSMKKLISLVLVLAISFAIAVPAFAVSNADSNLQIKDSQMVSAEAKENSINESKQPSKEFISYISDYFKNHQKYQVLDKQKKDINETFYQNNLKNYKELNFSTIHANAWNDVSCFCKQTITEEPSNLSFLKTSITPNSFRTQKVSNYYYHLLSGDVLDHNIEVKDTISGSFIYNPSTGIISQYNSPTLKVIFVSGVSGWNLVTNHTSTGAVLSSDKYTVTFSASFHVNGSVATDYGLIENDYGNVYDELEASGE